MYTCMYFVLLQVHVHVYMYRIPAPYTTCAQVEHNCRKDWDTYVQRLETVDVDRQTGSEVVHWVMRFPVSGEIHRSTPMAVLY